MALTRKFYLLLAGGIIVQAGVAAKNSLETLKITDDKIAMGAKGAFVLGWVVIAYSIALVGNKIPIALKTLLSVAGAAAVVVGVFHVKASKKEGKAPNKMIAMLFPAGWVLITLAILIGNTKNKYLAILGTALVLGSMMVVLPWQRENCLVDGPGYNLFVNAWWLLAIANN